MDPVDNDRFVISMTDPPTHAIAWLTEHGARPATGWTGPDGPGIGFDNGPGTPMHLAFPGDTLIHNPNGIITVT